MQNKKTYNKRYIVIVAAIAVALVIGFMMGRAGPALKYKSKNSVPVKKTVTQVIEAKKSVLPRITKKFANPKIAVVIDDFGYNINNLEKFLDIGESITLSILPNKRYSTKVAETAHSRGYETILHLPLEPKDGSVEEEPGTIKSSMSDSQIILRLKEDLDSVPYINGVSNHMGSKSTEESRLMSMVFGELKNRKIFFFDSLTSANSVCRDVAKSSGIRYARRDVFLDIPGEPADIERKILETRRLAFRKGYAIAVGHDKHNTVIALKKFMPEMASEGVKFVYISDFEK
ncbi:MAG: divergent polysaccharide deacetylase family protein [Candidatus Omnitrophica bacterium]|nr:divergent polysaccharide deacetylase family protein [Candidatus Omnitrophota bacterium]